MSAHGGAPRFEKTDVEPKVVVRFGVGLTIAIVLASVFLVGLMRLLGKRATEAEPAPAPLAITNLDRKPPEPRLQEQPFADIDRLRVEQRERLTTSGWIDKGAGVAHIPIEEAMKQLAAKGLPTRAGGQP